MGEKKEERVIDKEPPLKKSKQQNVEKYFDDQPKRKTKVSRLMKFMDKNKEFVQVGDDFEISISKRAIPGPDFIEIVHFLQKSCPRRGRLMTFIQSRDPRMGMPMGTRQFIDALHEAIEGESIKKDMTPNKITSFGKKLSEFAGLELAGVKNVITKMVWEKEKLEDEVHDDNEEYLVRMRVDEEREEEEQTHA